MQNDSFIWEYSFFKSKFNDVSVDSFTKSDLPEDMLSLRNLSRIIKKSYAEFYKKYSALPKFEFSQKTLFKSYKKSRGREVLTILLEKPDYDKLSSYNLKPDLKKINLHLIKCVRNGEVTYSSYFDNKDLVVSKRNFKRPCDISSKIIESYLEICRGDVFIHIVDVIGRHAPVFNREGISLFVHLNTNPFEKPDKIRFSIGGDFANAEYWINYFVRISDEPKIIYDFIDTCYDLRFTMVIMGDTSISEWQRKAIVDDSFDNFMVDKVDFNL